jgi:uncharacterized membrane protein
VGMGLAMIVVIVVMMALMGVAVVWGALTSARSRFRRTGTRRDAKPKQLFDERYAQGEISTDEYAERRHALAGLWPQQSLIRAYASAEPPDPKDPGHAQRRR